MDRQEPNDWTPEEQRRVLSEARAGSGEARGVLTRVYRRVLEGHLERRMGARLARFANVEDLAQEACARALGGLDALGDAALFEDFRGILLQNANWVLRDRGAQAQRFLSESVAYCADDGRVPERGADPPSAGPVTLHDEGLWLRALVDELDAKYAAVLELQLAGRSLQEIAGDLGLEYETARKRAQRALELLRLRAESERRRRDG